MFSRRLAPVALAAAVLLGTSGCAMISPQATTIPYSAAEGVNIPDSGPLTVRNALIVADEAGTAGNFVAAIVNDTDADELLYVGVAGAVLTVPVAANTTVSLGADADPLAIPALGSAPGTYVTISFQSGDAEGVTSSVPVLDGTLPQFADLVPAS